MIGGFSTADPTAMYRLLRLNVLAPTMLTSAVIGGMVERGRGAIINITSVLALLPEYAPGIYPATKSYLMTLSQSLAAEVPSKGVYVQAVLPAVTRTEIYERAGANVNRAVYRRALALLTAPHEQRHRWSVLLLLGRVTSHLGREDESEVWMRGAYGVATRYHPV